MTTLAWQQRAACRDVPGFTELLPVDAIPICLSDCPVRLACAEYAVNMVQRIGDAAHSVTYGGLTSDELSELVRRKQATQQKRAYSRSRAAA